MTSGPEFPVDFPFSQSFWQFNCSDLSIGVRRQGRFRLTTVVQTWILVTFITWPKESTRLQQPSFLFTSETVSTRNVRHRVHTQCGIVRPKHDRAWCGQSDCDGQPHNHSHFSIVLLVMMSELENRNVILYENKKKGHNYELRSQRRRGFLKISFPVIYSYVCVCVYLYM